jgi:hypothetical protein
MSSFTLSGGVRTRLLGVIVALLATALLLPAAASAKPAVETYKASVAKKPKKKKKKKKKAATAPTPAAPTPLALTYSEAYSRALSRAYEEYLIDVYADDYGVDGCVPVSTYVWNCLAWNHEVFGGDPYWCDWVETVNRVGYNGVTSSRTSAFDCYPASMRRR